MLFRPADGIGAAGAAIDEALEEVGLDRQKNRPADELAHGDQRLIDFAIALASQPKLLLLDEPTAGLSRGDTPMIISLIARLKESEVVPPVWTGSRRS